MSEPVDLAAVRMFVRAALTLGRDPRETFDMLGILFKGHPDLRRILMYPEFVGFPLRKDYPANKVQPLVPYRTEDEAGTILDKVAPFGGDEGMSFGRKFWLPTDTDSES